MLSCIEKQIERQKEKRNSKKNLLISTMRFIYRRLLCFYFDFKITLRFHMKKTTFSFLLVHFNSLRLGQKLQSQRIEVQRRWSKHKSSTA